MMSRETIFNFLKKNPDWQSLDNIRNALPQLDAKYINHLLHKIRKEKHDFIMYKLARTRGRYMQQYQYKWRN